MSIIKAALYVRVSTMEQIDGYSIGEQKDKLLHYASAQGYAVVDTYSDEGFSGKDLLRPNMERMLNDIQHGKINTVLVYKLDRLSRHVKDVLELVETFDKCNVTLYSLSENFDLASPFGRAALKMMATFAELERETIVERMEMGKIARAKEGKYTCPGTRCPFGYRHDKKNDRLLIEESEAEIIRKIFDLYVNHGYTFRKLYDYCREAYPDVKYFNNQMCCKPIIERPLYAGYFRYRGGELTKGTNFEAIISYELFLQAQAQVNRNHTKRLSDSSPYLLTGLLICGRCGNRYVGKMYERYTKKPDGTHTKHYRYRDYGCAARLKRDKNYHPAKCDNDIYRAEELEKIVEDYVLNLNIDDYNKADFSPGLIDKMMSEIGAIKRSQSKLLDLYLSGDIDKDTFLIRKIEYDSKIAELQNLIEKETESVQSAPTNAEAIKKSIAEYSILNRRQKRTLLEYLIKNIIVDGSRITVNLRLKK